MPAVNQTRTLGMECMAFLDNLSDYVCSSGEVKRTQLATLGRYENQAGISAGFFRTSFNAQFLDKVVELQDDEGKIREIILTYLRRCCVSDVTQTAFDPVSVNECDPCTPGTIEDYQEVKIDTTDLQTFCKKVTFSRRQWIQRCENPDVGMMRRWQTQIDALLCAADIFLIQEIIEGAGANNNHPTLADCTVPDETVIADYRELEIVDVDRNPVWAAVDEMFEDIAVNESGDCPIAILYGLKGGFATYARAEGFACCNDKGQDVEAVAGALDFLPFQSRHVQTAFENVGLLAADAANASVLIHPGSAHLIEIFKEEHDSFQDGESMSMVYTDPWSGERFDMIVIFDKCTRTYTFTFYKHVGVFTMPLDQYQNCDHLCNINGIFLYNFSRGV